jgi:hypothetical protein
MKYLPELNAARVRNRIWFSVESGIRYPIQTIPNSYRVTQFRYSSFETPIGIMLRDVKKK